MALPRNRGDREYFRFFQDNVAYTNDAGTAVAIGTFVGGQYNASAPTYANGDPVVFQFTSDGKLKTDASFTVEGDISIGGVEIKDATTDTRAKVKTDGTDNALVVMFNTPAAASSYSYQRITDGTDSAEVDSSGNLAVYLGTAIPAGTATIGSVKITDGTYALSVAKDNAAVPSYGLLALGTDGTNAQIISVSSTGLVNVADGGGNLSIDDGGNVISVDWNGTAPPIGAGVEATALRVTVATDSTGVLSVDDNGGSLTVDNAALSVVGGGLEATALRVTIASDSTGVLSVDDNGGNLSIDDGGNVISVDWNGTAPPIGAGLEATALRVTVATDSTGVLSVDDNAGSLTVDQGTPTNLKVQIFGDDTTSAINTDATGDLQVDVLTMPSLEIGEFPAAAAITDNFANPTTTNIMAMGMVYDGTTWDRMLGDATNGVLVNLGANNDVTVSDGGNVISVDWNGTAPPIGAGLEATALRVTVATDSTGVLSVDDNGGSLTVDGTFWQATQPVSIAAVVSTNWNGTAPPIGAGLEATALRVTVATDSTGVLSVDDNGASLTVDVGTALPTGTNAIGRVGHDVTGIADGRKTVSLAGTRETLVAGTTACKSVIITAETDNTGVMVVGGSACVAVLATRRGTPLNAGESVSMNIDDLVDIYLDTTVNGDGVTFTYLT